MAAFRLAASEGADMIEFDVRLTRDRVFAVQHDRTLKRTAGRRVLLRKKTLEELEKYDVGTWRGPRFRGERIPTLDAVLAWLPAGMGANIEVKTDGDRLRRKEMVHVLVSALRRTKVQHRVLVSSFDHRFLRLLHMHDPAIRLGVLYVPLRDAARRPSVIARRCGARAFICSRAQLRRRHSADAHAHGLTVIAYGVNSAAHLSAVRRRGSDAVITDHPALLIPLLHSGFST